MKQTINKTTNINDNIVNYNVIGDDNNDKDKNDIHKKIKIQIHVKKK